MVLLSQTFTSLEKQRDQAAAAGDNYHLDECGPTGLSQTGPTEEEGPYTRGTKVKTTVSVGGPIHWVGGGLSLQNRWC
jgi:hypothetical protein